MFFFFITPAHAPRIPSSKPDSDSDDADEYEVIEDPEDQQSQARLPASSPDPASRPPIATPVTRQDSSSRPPVPIPSTRMDPSTRPPIATPGGSSSRPPVAPKTQRSNSSGFPPPISPKPGPQEVYEVVDTPEDNERDRPRMPPPVVGRKPEPIQEDLYEPIENPAGDVYEITDGPMGPPSVSPKPVFEEEADDIYQNEPVLRHPGKFGRYKNLPDDRRTQPVKEGGYAKWTH